MKFFRLLPLLLLTLIGVVGTSSCIDDAITTSPSDILSFSTDTLSFDTVFTDLGTPTARLLVYNKAKKNIIISEIKFRNNNSNFQMNVDGMSGNSFHDIEIRGGDSIYIFVECFIPTTHTNQPTLISDQLDFTTNGVLQTVEVEAYGQNVTRLYAPHFYSDTTLSADQPYVIFDSLIVEQGATLTLLPGTRLMFHDKAYMKVNGTLNAIGAPNNLIELRGDRLDKVLPNLYYDQMSAQWEGITFTPNSFNNTMEFVDMRSTSKGIDIDSCGNLSQRKLLLRNSWLHNSAGSVITSRHAWVDAYGVIFSDAAYAVVSLTGGQHHMSQCTFSNYYLFAAPSQPILSLYHAIPQEQSPINAPYMVASFENSILYGITSPINIGDLSDSQVYLRNILIGADGDNDEHFIDCIWNKDPLFLTIRKDYYLNYHIESKSPAVGAGNPIYVTNLCQIDIEGNPRLPTASGNPTLGAYAHTVDSEN